MYYVVLHFSCQSLRRLPRNAQNSKQFWLTYCSQTYIGHLKIAQDSMAICLVGGGAPSIDEISSNFVDDLSNDHKGTLLLLGLGLLGVVGMRKLKAKSKLAFNF